MVEYLQINCVRIVFVFAVPKTARAADQGVGAALIEGLFLIAALAVLVGLTTKTLVQSEDARFRVGRTLKGISRLIGILFVLGASITIAYSIFA